MISGFINEAAAYACAAGRIGKHDLVGDALFAKQESWSKDAKVDETVSSVRNAVDMKQVRALAKAPEIAQEIEQDIQLGKTASLSQTPAYGDDAHKYPIFRRLIDDQLQK